MKLSGLPDLSVASIGDPRVSKGMRDFKPHRSWKIPGALSLRVHIGCLPASGPALALVLHLPVKCGSRTLNWNFAAGSFHARKGIVRVGFYSGLSVWLV